MPRLALILTVLSVQAALGPAAGRLRAGDEGAAPATAGDEPLERQTNPEMPATGAHHPGLAPFDELMRSYLAEHELPGAALAVARDGRLVYARGFGWGDVEANEAVRPDSLFRIASISKPITAAAVLQLVDAGRLHLDDRILDVLGTRAPFPEEGADDERLRQVTVRQLLQHTGGWDRGVSFDPMFRSVEFAEALGQAPPADADAVIRVMMGRPLDFDPGARYAYSNYGYCLLGRIVEEAAGRPYEEHVRSSVLKPLGITRMRIGRTLPEGRATGEVRYYTRNGATGPAVLGPRIGRPVPQPYGAWHLEAMDSHGGWIGSAVDLVRFACAFDPESPQLLRQETVATMAGRPEGAAGTEPDGSPKAAWYGCGWLVRPAGTEGRCNLWHTGSLPGTSTILVRRHDGLCWAVLFNMRETEGGTAAAARIDPLVHLAAGRVRQWPDHDLFEEWMPADPEPRP